MSEASAREAQTAAAPPAPSGAAPKRSDLPARLATDAVLVPSVIFVIAQGGLLYLGVVVLFVLLGKG